MPAKKTDDKTIYKDVVIEGIQRTLKDGNVTPASVEKSMEKVMKDSVSSFVDGKDLQERAIQAFLEKSDVPQVIEIRDGKKVKKLSGMHHKMFTDLFTLVEKDLPTMIVGLPGAGKTTACEKVAEALSLSFHAMSIGMQTTKTDIMGFIDANGKYQPTGFRKAFEKGGVFLMDEIDAGNPNVLIMINSAISNGFVEFPDKMVTRHKDFRFIGTANTYGNGSDGRFVGRNKLDSATLDRFVVLNWEVDELLEEMLCPNKGWLKKIRTLRKATEKNSVNLMVTPRMAIFGAKLLEAGFTEKRVKEMVLFKGLDKDTRTFVEKNFTS